MTPIERIWRFFFVGFLTAVLSLTCDAAEKVQIVPLRTTATFSAQSAQDRWSVPIKSTGGRIVYILSLEPDYWVGNQKIEGLDLVLRYPSDKSKDSNLLAPQGNWHGLQDYDFPALDLRRGVKNTIFGEKRTITVKRLGLTIRINLKDAKISPISEGNYQLEALDLQIEVDNLNP